MDNWSQAFARGRKPDTVDAKWLYSDGSVGSIRSTGDVPWLDYGSVAPEVQFGGSTLVAMDFDDRTDEEIERALLALTEALAERTRVVQKDEGGNTAFMLDLRDDGDADKVREAWAAEAGLPLDFRSLLPLTVTTGLSSEQMLAVWTEYLKDAPTDIEQPPAGPEPEYKPRVPIAEDFTGIAAAMKALHDG
jgi:hypothetical protein